MVRKVFSKACIMPHASAATDCFGLKSASNDLELFDGVAVLTNDGVCSKCRERIDIRSLFAGAASSKAVRMGADSSAALSQLI